MIGIGIDTGGTCTDAVACDLEKEEILASAKSATTHEKLEKGIHEGQQTGQAIKRKQKIFVLPCQIGMTYQVCFPQNRNFFVKTKIPDVL